LIAIFLRWIYEGVLGILSELICKQMMLAGNRNPRK
jgi:hypothetical protein